MPTNVVACALKVGSMILPISPMIVANACAILSQVNLALGVQGLFLFSGSQIGIQYSIQWFAAQHTNHKAKEILSGFSAPNVWITNGAFTGDAIIVDLGAEHPVTALEIQNYKMGTSRATKRARIHGSLGDDGPWTVLLELSWDDIETVEPVKEVHPIPETTMRYVKLEIVEHVFTGPAWAFLHVQTGSKAILCTLWFDSAKIHGMILADGLDTKFSGAEPFSIVASCSSGCSVFAKKNGQKSSRCSQTECSSSGRRRKRSTELLQYR